jgi:hypothetical protein
VLDLDARVHFDEVELAVLVQEFECAGAAVADPLAGFRATLAEGGDLCLRDAGGRRLLDHLLVPPLQRTVAAAQPQRRTETIGNHLDLDVARMTEEFLDVDISIAESPARLLLRQCNEVEQRRGIIHHPHPAPTATARSLDNHRISDPIRHGLSTNGIRRQSLIWPRHTRNARRPHRPLRRNLVPHGPNTRGARTHKHQPSLCHPVGEPGILRQKAVARMNRLRPRHLRREQQCRLVEIAARRRTRPDAQRLISLPHIRRFGVGL